MLIWLAITGIWPPLVNYFPSLRGRVEVVSPEPLLTMDSTWLTPQAAFQATAAPAEERGDRVANGTRSVRLYSVGGRPVYDVETDVRRYWIRADTGEPFRLSMEEAQRVVEQRYGLPPGSMVGETERDRSWGYWGQVGFPAFVFHHPDNPRTAFAIQPNNGQIFTLTPNSRLTDFMLRSHTFWPMELLTGRPPQRAVLFLSGILTLALGITGYFLLFPLRFRKKKRP